MYTFGSIANPQRMPTEINKTCGIAKIRILMKQVILETFKVELSRLREFLPN